MAMEVDVKRVNINLENLKVQYDNAQAMLEQHPVSYTHLDVSKNQTLVGPPL